MSPLMYTDGMDDSQWSLEKRWVETWQKLACQFARPRPTSGLVEQQRLFQKLRHLPENRGE